jgi:1-acyl-sn-glycerol-3-phosphate acyltransferase
MALKSRVSHEKIESPPLSYTITVRFLSIILNLYYRRIETWGAENIPKQGPTIFVVAPHCNQVLQIDFRTQYRGILTA